MSYCRFSDMNYKCDIYAYDDIDGQIAVHVASGRYVGDIPPVQFPNSFLDDAQIEKYANSLRKQSDFLQTAQTKPIGGKYDGKTFYVDNENDLAELLQELKSEGYLFPESLLIPASE